MTIHNDNNNRKKDNDMTAPAPKAPAKRAAPKKKSDHQIIAEDLLAAAKKYNLCDQFYTEMAKINAKLDTKFPEELFQQEMRMTFYFNDNELWWENAPTDRFGELPNKDMKALEAHLNKALKEAVASFQPSQGKVRTSGSKAAFTVYMEECYSTNR